MFSLVRKRGTRRELKGLEIIQHWSRKVKILFILHIDVGKVLAKKSGLFYIGKLCFPKTVLSNRNIMQVTYEIIFTVVTLKCNKE